MQWFEREEFWEWFGPTLFGPERIAAAPKQVELVRALLGLNPPGEVLDLCCGPGRHAVELARAGFLVTGVDRTERFLEAARSRASAEGLDVRLARADMRDFREPGRFDAAINMFTSFGYFEDPDDDRLVAANLHISLKPGGGVLFEMMSREVLARVFRERDWSRDEEGALLLEERKLSQNWGWVESRWIRISGAERHEMVFGHRLYTATELEALLRSVGFDDVRAFGSLEGTPYDHNARRLVMTARKPA